MQTLILGLIILAGMHWAVAIPAVRHSLVERLGETHFKTAFSAIALGSLVMVAAGKANAEWRVLWDPPIWGREAALVLMAPAMVLIISAYAGSNLQRLLGHPMLIGVLLWALAHLLANGDLASVVLFGGFALFALVERVLLFWRRTGKAARAVPLRRELFSLAIGLAAYGALLILHPLLFGVSAY